jgi:hypothetical protein
MSRSKLARLTGVAALGFALFGCADYLNRYDTVTLAAGDAQKHNRLLHAVDSFNPDSEEVVLDADGNVVLTAVKKFKTPDAAATPPANVTVNVGAPAGQ